MRTKVTGGTVYQFCEMPSAPHSCDGCVGENNISLCKKLNVGCHGSIWQIATARRTETTKEWDALQLGLRNYSQLAAAIQCAGGAVELLEHPEVLRLLETLARNNITLKAEYAKHH
jgi:hypothetical protein